MHRLGVLQREASRSDENRYDVTVKSILLRLRRKVVEQEKHHDKQFQPQKTFHLIHSQSF